MTDWYVYPERDSAWELHSWHADRLMRWCARDLRIPEQRIRWHGEPVKARHGQLWGDAVGTSRYTVHSQYRRGWVDDSPGIAVVVGQSELEMLRTVAHEMYHRHERHEGLSTDEECAEAYARRIADDYTARRIP